ncbi:MAG: hypothetical protein SW833_11715 [Cyanobacteriota bacterium]|nr:hypothetical protein [Cyanobacteriota bacterium]
MPYSQFTIETVKTKFDISISEEFGIFAEIPESNYSDFLAQSLREYVPLALAVTTEKARSAFIIAPILFELRKQFKNKISLFSGREFNVENQKGLTGLRDFLICNSSEQLAIETPVIALVEAKNDNIQSGLGQCMAEMIAAQLFNQRNQREAKIIYGAATTGTNWKFMRLEGKTISVDLNEYFLNNVGKLLGILKHCIESSHLSTLFPEEERYC